MRRMSAGLLLVLLLLSMLLLPANYGQGANLKEGSALRAVEGQTDSHAHHEELYKVINFAILAVALVFLLRKPVANFFAQRSAAIQQSLEDARAALKQAEAQLQAIEEKLKQLDCEVAALKAEAQSEADAEAERLRKVSSEDAAKIFEAARAQMDTDLRVAKLELKAYAAQEALRMAEDMIRERLDDQKRRGLVAQFVESLPRSSDNQP